MGIKGEPDLNDAFARTASAGSGDAAPLVAGPSIGSVFADRYRITRFLGRGGMGAVYAAHDALADREVALKLVSRAGLDSAHLRDEMRASLALTHKNIARTYTLEEAGDEVFIVMELLVGETLADRIARGPLPRADAIAIAAQLCDALAEAHGRGVVHRDVKPANIMCCADRVVLMDFGLARFDDADTATHTTSIKGTPAYMAPEVVSGRRADARADLYALGLILFEMITGKPPFQAATVTELMHKQLSSPVDVGMLDRDMARLIERLVAKDPDARPRSAAEVRAALVEPAVRRRRWPYVLAAGGLAIAVGVTVMVVGDHPRPPAPAPTPDPFAFPAVADIAKWEPPPEDREHYARAQEVSAEGMRAFDAKRFDEAGRLSESAFTAYPYPGFLFNAARAYLMAGNYERAAYLARQLRSLAKDPLLQRSADAILDEAKRSSPIAREPEVDSMGSSTPSEFTVPARHAFEKGEVAYQAGRYDEAAQLFVEGYSVMKAPQFLYNAAAAYRSAGKLDEAVLYFRRFALETPELDQRDAAERKVHELEAIIAKRAGSAAAP